MAISTTCPHCGETSQIKEKYAGQRGSCPKCGGRIRVARQESDESRPERTSRRDRDSSRSGRERSSRRRSESKRDDSRDRRRSRSSERRRRDRKDRKRDAATDELSGIVASISEQEARGVTTVTLPSRRGSDPQLHPALIALAAVVATAVVIGLFAIVLSVSNDTPGRLADGAERVVADDGPRIEDYPPNEVPPHVLHEIAERHTREARARNAERAKAAEARKNAPIRSLEDMIARVENGIVLLLSKTQGEVFAQGTGFVISEDGVVVTNLHVVTGAEQIDAVFNNGSRRQITGFVSAWPETDMIALKLADFPASMAVLEYSERRPRKGAEVFAIGHPHGYAFSVTQGIVSNFVYTRQLPESARRFLHTFVEGDQLRWVQHDAAISSGNSGGPLLDAKGQVIGINTWGSQQTNLGFALARESFRIEPPHGSSQPLRPLTELPSSLLPDPSSFEATVRETTTSLSRLRIPGRRVDDAKDFGTLQKVSMVALLFQNIRPRLDGENIQGDRRSVGWRVIKSSVDSMLTSLAAERQLEHLTPAELNTFGLKALADGDPTYLIGTIKELRSLDSASGDARQTVVIECPGSDVTLVAPWHESARFENTWYAFNGPVGDRCVVMAIGGLAIEGSAAADDGVGDSIFLYNSLLVPTQRRDSQSESDTDRSE